MLNEKVEVEGAMMGAYLTGASSEPRPGIILLQEIFGVNNAMKIAADAFARDGYVVLAPDIFHRIRPGIQLGYTESERDQAIGYWGQLDDAQTQADVMASVEKLKNHTSCTGKVAALGFCLGGKLALFSSIGGYVDAAVSFYPVTVPQYKDELTKLSCPVQIHLGDVDQHTPPEIQDILRAAAGQSSSHEYYLHEGAGHGFYNPVRSFGYHPQAAADAHAAVLRFLRKTIGPFA
ncbi:dienelactone hydrolase family protein [Rhizobiales bacterium]|uniref:dienelactone hydrolase family protein n=1 Tax=Hongsoonwoonella zoysiae TaxID=2821844 RepID=UPI001561ACF9|nr:dienelactone hydrolase family protein [Hongsoonwoonella zoysiae]NRG16214.1 dienelactone hydrolase family protein [Hongsoonwoonella zoysiae]